MPPNVKNEYLSRLITKAQAFCTSVYLWVSLASTQTLTVPYTSIELHPKADTHNPVSEGVEAHHAGHNGRAQVFQHNVIGVLIP